MVVEEMILIITRLGIGAIATFLAIILWSKTRDTAWMFVVIGTIVNYGEIVFSTLEKFGVVRTDYIVIRGISVVKVGFANLPMLFFIIAFMIMIIRKRKL